MDEERYDRERKIYKNYCDQKASILNEDDEVTFTVHGNCPVDVTGNVVVMLPPNDYGEDDEEIDSDEYDEEEVDSDDIGDEFDGEVVGESDEEELTEEELKRLREELAEMESDVYSSLITVCVGRR